MANLPESLFADSLAAGATMSGLDRSVHTDPKVASVVHWIQALQSHETREQALIVLSKNREIRKDLAPLLWNSFGTISALLLEIISVYCLLSSPNLTDRVSMRVSNALALFQCVASHPDTRMQFLKAKLPYYLYPFLSSKNKEKAHEYLRLTSLGVIGALVKSGDPEVITFLIETQIFPCCLDSMEVGSELSKTVATFIVHQILLHDEGLKYCCSVAERFFAVARVLGQMTEKIAEEPCPRLLKHIIRCYRRLSENPRACDGLRCCLPVKLTDNTFANQLLGDQETMGYLQELFNNVAARQQARVLPL